MASTGSQSPVGTLDELKLLGVNPLDWGSCAPMSGAQKGCPDYARCIFAHAENGGFRGKGPRNIGVLKVNNELGNAVEDVVTCFNYMRNMHDHNQGDGIMKYAVIAQEGEEIETVLHTPVDPNSNRTGNVKMKMEAKKITVGAFPRPGLPGSKIEPTGVHAQATLQRHAERLRKARKESAMLRSISAPVADAVAANDAFAAESPTQMVPDVVEPAPIVPRRRGRPPKAR